MELELFYKRCATLAEHLDKSRDQIHELLARYETYEVIQHEIESGIRALKNVQVEYSGFEQPGSKITASCFLPVNMPLYSLILYGVVPSFYFETIYIRPGVSLSEYIPALIKILKINELGFDQIKVKDLPAKLFVDLYAKDSEVILFTGKYENALMLERECPDSMLIFEGTGPCPFFIFENADIDLAVQKAVAIRCFNSGQDCIAPDVMFVHQSNIDEFTKKLADAAQNVRVGSSEDKSVRITHTIKEKYLLSVERWLEKNREHIVFGGEIDTKQLIIHPTILNLDIKQHKGSFKELFSPIFYLVSYKDNSSLLEVINTPTFKERSMYACVFGENDKVTDALKLCTILKNTTVNDREDGNKPYGGYGPIANFVSYKGKRRARPLLISRDVREWMLLNQSSSLPKNALQVA